MTSQSHQTTGPLPVEPIHFAQHYDSEAKYYARFPSLLTVWEPSEPTYQALLDPSNLTEPKHLAEWWDLLANNYGLWLLTLPDQPEQAEDEAAYEEAMMALWSGEIGQ